MPVYNTRDESGRLGIRLKALSLAEQDIVDFGPIERSDEGLEARAKYHVRQMQRNLPTPQTILADDLAALTHIVVEHYALAYTGLFAGYTGLKAPFQLSVEPRYTTAAHFDDSEDEYSFVGLVGLQAIIRKEQALRRKNAEFDGCDPREYLLTLVQVTISDAKEPDASGSCQYICYDLEGDEIIGIFAREGVSEEVLCGLGIDMCS